jgi:hypothetical protein
VPRPRREWYPTAILPDWRKERLMSLRQDYVYRGDGEDLWDGSYEDPSLNSDGEGA